MAQGAVAPTLMPLNNGTNGVGLSAEELREIQEYEKIVKFRDEILAGTHPTIKVPAHLLGLGKQKVSTPLPTHQQVTPNNNFESSTPTHNKSPDNNPTAMNGLNTFSAKPARSEINPILLEKSDDLIKAELQLRRQRLERALREQLEQQKLSSKALLQSSESLPNFDISEVLIQALVKVPPSAAVEVEPSVGAASASDSFDENTFYSSQHDTPEPSTPEQSQKDQARLQSGAVVSVDKPVESSSANRQVADGDVAMTRISPSNDHSARPPPFQHQDQINNQQPVRGGVQSNGPSMEGVTIVSAQKEVSDASTNPQNDVAGSSDRPSQRVNDRTAGRAPTERLHPGAFLSPSATLVRAHDLSPVAPRPSRVSPLATAREPPVPQEALPADPAQPAQISALRNEAPRVPSTDSSRGGKSAEKKEKRKKKRNGSNKDNADTPESPRIKTEPRSVSPYHVAPLSRPAKRQRQTGHYAAELNYDETRPGSGEHLQERVAEQYQDLRPSQADDLDRYGVPQSRDPFRPFERDEDDSRRISSDNFIRRPESPRVYALPYTPTETRSMRAPSHAIVERRVHDEPRYYRDSHIPVRASVRPEADRERSRSPVMRERSPIPMGPPRQPVRIVVDAYGREYLDQIPTPSMRQSVAPPLRQSESDIYYERAPARSISGRLPMDTFEENGVVYRRASPAIGVPRRVITQPEYAQPEYRSYRQREYPVRPGGEEFLKVREPERRPISHIEEAPREYISRASSIRPESVRYEVSREYVGRVSSVRPEGNLREYASSVYPETRREIVPQSAREYSVRPMEMVPRREYVTDMEHERRHEGETRKPSEFGFVEQPRQRETSVLVYADDVRRDAREVYR